MHNGRSFTAAISGWTIKRPGGNQPKSRTGSEGTTQGCGGARRGREDKGRYARQAGPHLTFRFRFFCQGQREESVRQRVEWGLKGLEVVVKAQQRKAKFQSIKLRVQGIHLSSGVVKCILIRFHRRPLLDSQAEWHGP